MIYEHYNEAPWNKRRWPNFSPAEVACRHCGELYLDEVALDTMQRCRDFYGSALRLNSAHRCALHNARIGGAPQSQHKRIAFDISIVGKDKARVLFAAQSAGFRTFGFYETFLHVDMRPGRAWSTKKGKEVWSGLIS